MEVSPIRVTQPIVIEKPGRTKNYPGSRKLENYPLKTGKKESKQRYYQGRSLNYLI